MKDKKHITCDITVIGAGFAGMVAAARASDLGLKTVQTGNSSQLYFASGLFDFLGVYPLHSRTPLKDPRTGLKLLQKEMPGHPYSKTSLEAILKSFDFLSRFLQSAGLNYIKPDFVHIMLDGQIAESGGPDLALMLEEQGYDWVREKSNPVSA